MTAEEIKQAHSMRSIVDRYSIKVNRQGMCSCPFHGADRKPSMKIYKDSYYCFTCQRTGDIFSFIQEMDNCDFKTAFYSLGGEYQKPNKASRTALYRLKKAQEKREREAQKIKDDKFQNSMLIHAYRELLKKQTPLSEDWWYYLDKYEMAIIKDINMEGGVSS